MSTSLPPPRDRSRDAENPLARAFRSFTEAAGSLERTYGQLHGQVAHLRHELEVTNRNLTVSLDENRRIRKRLRRIVEGLPCGVLVLEADGKISMLNPEAERLLGAKFAAVETLPSPLRDALENARQSGEELELELLQPENSADDGKSAQARIWIAIRHAPLEAGTAASSSVFILRDTSAARQLERDRENLRRQQALVEMSALLAHEIRNPLGSLELFAGLLADASLGEESRRWVEHVQAGLRTLSSTVNNVLDLHSAPSPKRASLDSGELLDWAYNFLLPLAHQARVELQIVNGLAGVRLEADRHLLEQVLLNLALNALHFMPGGGWLAIRGIHLGMNGVEIEVQDTGSGIAAEDLPRIFDAGFTTRPGSTGLGLAVCRRILELHGGAISAKSKPGHGACFRLRLPAAQATRAGENGAEGVTA